MLEWNQVNCHWVSLLTGSVTQYTWQNLAGVQVDGRLMLLEDAQVSST